MYTLTRSIINCMLADIVRTSVYLSNHTIFIRPVGRFNFLSRAAFWPPVFRRVSGSIFISEWRYQFSLIRLSIRSYLLGLRSTKLNILSIRRHRMASVSWTSAFPFSFSINPSMQHRDRKIDSSRSRGMIYCIFVSVSRRENGGSNPVL